MGIVGCLVFQLFTEFE